MNEKMPTSSLRQQTRELLARLLDEPTLAPALREQVQGLAQQYDAEDAKPSEADLEEEVVFPEGYVNPLWGCDVLEKAIEKMRAEGRPSSEIDAVYAAHAPRILDSIAWEDQMHGETNGYPAMQARLRSLRKKHDVTKHHRRAGYPRMIGQ
jgi:hypothetical protein